MFEDEEDLAGVTHLKSMKSLEAKADDKLAVALIALPFLLPCINSNMVPMVFNDPTLMEFVKCDWSGLLILADEFNVENRLIFQR